MARAVRAVIGEKTRGDVYSAECPCRDLLDVIANKWAALAIGALADGSVRFGALQRQLTGVSPKVSPRHCGAWRSSD